MTDQTVRFQPTPNPNSMKFILNKRVIPTGMRQYQGKEEAEGEPVVQKLFSIEGVEGVFLMDNFVSVNKKSSGNWGVIVPKVIEILKEL